MTSEDQRHQKKGEGNVEAGFLVSERFNISTCHNPLPFATSCNFHGVLVLRSSALDCLGSGFGLSNVSKVFAADYVDLQLWASETTYICKYICIYIPLRGEGQEMRLNKQINTQYQNDGDDRKIEERRVYIHS
jgi:hypothetical protein